MQQQVLKFSFVRLVIFGVCVLCRSGAGATCVPSGLCVAMSEHWKTQTARSTHLRFPLLEKCTPIQQWNARYLTKRVKNWCNQNSHHAPVCVGKRSLSAFCLLLPHCFWTVYCSQGGYTSVGGLDQSTLHARSEKMKIRWWNPVGLHLSSAYKRSSRKSVVYILRTRS